VKPGDVVHNAETGEAYDVISVMWRENVGWEVDTVDPANFAGPRFYPHPDQMPDCDPFITANDITW
jgi:hypothetical protein